jgi:hypothetical protein
MAPFGHLDLVTSLMALAALVPTLSVLVEFVSPWVPEFRQEIH